MLRVQPKTMLYLSGAMWFFVGFLLMWKGIGYFEACLQNFQEHELPLLKALSSSLGRISEAIIACVIASLLLGMFKGKTVLRKSAQRGIQRIRSFSGATSLLRLYPPVYYALYAAMMGMGALLSFFGCPIDIRACIDVAMGSALIHGSMPYFREAAIELKRKPQEHPL